MVAMPEGGISVTSHPAPLIPAFKLEEAALPLRFRLPLEGKVPRRGG